MADSPAVRLTAFSHLCVSVSDIDRSLAFYEDLLGLERVFDVTLEGEALDTVTDDEGSNGRMIGLVVPGSEVVVELLCFGHRDSADPGAAAYGYTNMSFNVDDLDAAHAGLVAAGLRVGPIADFDGVRMCFITDPDGTPIELVEYPGPTRTNAEYQRQRR